MKTKRSLSQVLVRLSRLAREHSPEVVPTEEGGITGGAGVGPSRGVAGAVLAKRPRRFWRLSRELASGEAPYPLQSAAFPWKVLHTNL